MHEWEALTCLQTKLQVVFGDNEDGHGFDKKEESKSDAERSLASFFQLEVMRRYGKKGLAVGGGGSQEKCAGSSRRSGFRTVPATPSRDGRFRDILTSG